MSLATETGIEKTRYPVTGKQNTKTPGMQRTSKGNKTDGLTESERKTGTKKTHKGGEGNREQVKLIEAEQPVTQAGKYTKTGIKSTKSTTGNR